MGAPTTLATLRPVPTAPIVSTLGPVHPDALSVDIFEDILRAAVTRDFLPYDKDRRWGGEKDETVLREDVVHQPENTLIPTLTRRGRGTVKVFTYGHRDSVVDEAAELAAKLAVVHGADNARGPQDFSWGPLTCCALGRIRTCNLLIRSSSRIGQ
ncbi:hypothetical protein GCM10010342_21900 [Streptomyces anulatus]|nr:hypothetical protein GCM10010342_21900 [Streptomyces anulatus]